MVALLTSKLATTTKTKTLIEKKLNYIIHQLSEQNRKKGDIFGTSEYTVIL